MIVKAEGLGFMNTDPYTTNNSVESISDIEPTNLTSSSNNDPNQGTIITIMEFLNRKKKKSKDLPLKLSKKSIAINKYREMISIKDKADNIFIGVSIDCRT